MVSWNCSWIGRHHLRSAVHHLRFDLFWFPVASLEDIANRENIIGWEASYEPLADNTTDDSKLDNLPDENGENSRSNRLSRRLPASMQVEKKNALNSWKELRGLPHIFPDIPLNSVVAERHEEVGDGKARVRIKSNGKITGRGTDYFAYLQVVNGTLDAYARQVRSLEEKYWIGLYPHPEHKGCGFIHKGEPFCITFSYDVNVPKLIKRMFKCSPPFRLMGEPEEIGTDYYAVDAVDLHINQPVSFEIAPDLMRIYLYEGTCGNTIVRIIKALQHGVDSNLSHPVLNNGSPDLVALSKDYKSEVLV